MPETYLYQLRVDPSEHAVTEKLSEILLEKGKIKKGPKNKVAKGALLKYLLYCAFDMYKEQIFPKEANEIDVQQPEIETEVQ